MDRKVMLRRRFAAWRGTMRCLIGKSEFRIFFFFFSSILVPFFCISRYIASVIRLVVKRTLHRISIERDFRVAFEIASTDRRRSQGNDFSQGRNCI